MQYLNKYRQNKTKSCSKLPILLFVSLSETRVISCPKWRCDVDYYSIQFKTKEYVLAIIVLLNFSAYVRTDVMSKIQLHMIIELQNITFNQ